MNYIKVSYRDIAKMLVKAMPVELEAFSDKVNGYLDTIKAMPGEAKIALKSAYIFSRKVPREEREDLFQDLALAILKTKTGDERLAYAIARCDWRNWWSKFRIRQHYSLDQVIDHDDGSPITLGEMIVGECEFELKIDGDLDGQRIWDRLPSNIKPLILKRLEGKPIITRYQKGRPKSEATLTDCERKRLNRWIHKEGYQLLVA